MVLFPSLSVTFWVAFVVGFFCLVFPPLEKPKPANSVEYKSSASTADLTSKLRALLEKLLF